VKFGSVSISLYVEAEVAIFRGVSAGLSGATLRERVAVAVHLENVDMAAPRHVSDESVRGLYQPKTVMFLK